MDERPGHVHLLLMHSKPVGMEKFYNRYTFYADAPYVFHRHSTHCKEVRDRNTRKAGQRAALHDIWPETCGRTTSAAVSKSRSAWIEVSTVLI